MRYKAKYFDDIKLLGISYFDASSYEEAKQVAFDLKSYRTTYMYLYRDMETKFMSFERIEV